MKVIAITKVKSSDGKVVDRMQTMIVTLQPGDQTMSDTIAYVRPDDFDANSLLAEANRP